MQSHIRALIKALPAKLSANFCDRLVPILQVTDVPFAASDTRRSSYSQLLLRGPVEQEPRTQCILVAFKKCSHGPPLAAVERMYVQSL